MKNGSNDPILIHPSKHESLRSELFPDGSWKDSETVFKLFMD